MEKKSREECELIEEIMSLERERKDLLRSLTPTVSHWIHEGGEATTSASVQQPSTLAPRDGNAQLASLFNVMLEDTEDFGHRMLSMAYVVDKPGPPLPLYKANELVSRTSTSSRISDEFYNDTKNNNVQEEEQGGDFLFHFRNYLQFSENYKNELALNLTEEEKKEEEKKKEKEKEEEEEKKKEKEEEEMDQEEYASTMEFLNSMMDFRKSCFSRHRACWERVWGSDTGRCGGFGDTTTLSSMQFTHYTPGTIPSSHAVVTGSTLQIYSIKIIKLKGNLNWPLKVYGVVAARDTVDRNRNILFSRSRRNYQLLTKKEPFLHLTGPSRAILAVDPVDFEAELEINEGAESISLHKSYSSKGSTSLFFHSPNCIMELSVGLLATSLQATIIGVRVVKGSWPFKHGCRVVCAEVNGIPMPREVVLLDYHGKVVRVGSDGYLHLSRNVVSVDLHGPLRVVIQAYSESGCQAQEGHVDFPVQYCQTSKREFSIGNSKLEIVVAWSLIVKEKLDPSVDCLAVETYIAQP